MNENSRALLMPRWRKTERPAPPLTEPPGGVGAPAWLAAAATVAVLLWWRGFRRRSPEECRQAPAEPQSPDASLWWHSPLASPEEAVLVARALARLVKEMPTAALEEPHLDLLLLRRLRSLGQPASGGKGGGEARNTSGGGAGGEEAAEAELISAVAESLKWRRAHVPRVPACRYPGYHHAAGELPLGAWAGDYLQVGVP